MSAETLRLLEVNRTRKRRCTGADWLAMWGFVYFVALVTNSVIVPVPLSGWSVYAPVAVLNATITWFCTTSNFYLVKAIFMGSAAITVLGILYPSNGSSVFGHAVLFVLLGLTILAAAAYRAGQQGPAGNNLSAKQQHLLGLISTNEYHRRHKLEQAAAFSAVGSSASGSTSPAVLYQRREGQEQYIDQQNKQRRLDQEHQAESGLRQRQQQYKQRLQQEEQQGHHPATAAPTAAPATLHTPRSVPHQHHQLVAHPSTILGHSAPRNQLPLPSMTDPRNEEEDWDPHQRIVTSPQLDRYLHAREAAKNESPMHDGYHGQSPMHQTPSYGLFSSPSGTMQTPPQYKHCRPQQMKQTQAQSSTPVKVFDELRVDQNNAITTIKRSLETAMQQVVDHWDSQNRISGFVLSTVLFYGTQQLDEFVRNKDPALLVGIKLLKPFFTIQGLTPDNILNRLKKLGKRGNLDSILMQDLPIIMHFWCCFYCTDRQHGTPPALPVSPHDPRAQGGNPTIVEFEPGRWEVAMNGESFSDSTVRSAMLFDCC
jgi:hypothetical protein